MGRWRETLILPRSCEEALRREQPIYDNLKKYPHILQFQAQRSLPQGAPPRLALAPLGNVRQHIEELAEYKLLSHQRSRFVFTL